MWIRVHPYKATHFENRKSILHFIAWFCIWIPITIIWAYQIYFKFSIAWVGCMNVTDDRQTTDGRTNDDSERERTFAKNYNWCNKYNKYVSQWTNYILVTFDLDLWHWNYFIRKLPISWTLPDSFNAVVRGNVKRAEMSIIWLWHLIPGAIIDGSVQGRAPSDTV